MNEKREREKRVISPQVSVEGWESRKREGGSHAELAHGELATESPHATAVVAVVDTDVVVDGAGEGRRG